MICCRFHTASCCARARTAIAWTTQSGRLAEPGAGFQEVATRKPEGHQRGAKPQRQLWLAQVDRPAQRRAEVAQLWLELREPVLLLGAEPPPSTYDAAPVRPAPPAAAHPVDGRAELAAPAGIRLADAPRPTRSQAGARPGDGRARSLRRRSAHRVGTAARDTRRRLRRPSRCHRRRRVHRGRARSDGWSGCRRAECRTR